MIDVIDYLLMTPVSLPVLVILRHFEETDCETRALMSVLTLRKFYVTFLVVLATVVAHYRKFFTSREL